MNDARTVLGIDDGVTLLEFHLEIPLSNAPARIDPGYAGMTRRSDRSGALGRNRTYDLRIRSPPLYPTELQGPARHLSPLQASCRPPGSSRGNSGDVQPCLDAHTSLTGKEDKGELHRELKNQLGDFVADSMMNLLPNEGWTDVARTRDIDRVLAESIARFDQFEARIDERFRNFEVRMDAKFAHFEEKIDAKFAHYEARIDDTFAHFQAQMDERFAHFQNQMDERFRHFQNQMDERFEHFQKQMDDRFAHFKGAMDANFEHFDAQMNVRFSESDRRLGSLTGALWMLGGMSATAFIALFTILATR
jgi:hypothetical protein